jgi:hypothetical protein
VVGDYLFSTKTNNEFSPGNNGTGLNYAARGAIEFPISSLGFMAEADYRQWQYPHNSNGGACPGDPGCVTVIGNYGQTNVPSFTARDQDIDGRVGIGIAPIGLYLDASYLRRSSNYGYPVNSGIGFGIEKLPNLDQIFSIYGSFLYYPSISGNYTDTSTGFYGGTTWKVEYQAWKYSVGATLGLGKSPLFIEAGFLGDKGTAKSASPSGYSHTGINAGIGLHF